jgi:hypothetical protein
VKVCIFSYVLNEEPHRYEATVWNAADSLLGYPTGLKISAFVKEFRTAVDPTQIDTNVDFLESKPLGHERCPVLSLYPYNVRN